MEPENEEFYEILTNMTFYQIQNQNGKLREDLKSKLDFLEKGIKVLSEEDRKIIKLYVYENQSARVIGDIFNVSRNTVTRRLKKIAKIIADAYLFCC